MRFALPLLASVCLAASAPGDVVHLRNGEEVEGTVTRDGDKVTVTRADGTRLTLPAGEVDRIDAVQAEEPDAVPAAGSLWAEISAEMAKRSETEAAFRKLANADAKEVARAEAALKTSGEKAVPGLVHVLGQSTEAAERALAAKALGEIASSSSVPALIAAASDGDAAVRLEAVEALGSVGSAPAQPALIKALLDDPAADVQAAAAAALLRRGDSFAVPFLLHALGRPHLRQMIEESLLRWPDPVTLSFIRPLLDSKDAEARKSALRLVSEAALPCNLPVLRRLQDEKDPLVKRAAARGLARLRARRDWAVPVLISIVEDGDDAESLDAAAQLKKLTGKDFAQDAGAWVDWWKATVPLRIWVVPFGNAGRDTAQKVAANLQGDLKLPAGVWPEPLDLPAGARFESGQYNADYLLDALDALARKAPDALRFVGVTEADVALPGRGYLFSPVRPGGPAVVSTRRIGSREPAAANLRAAVQALHAAGISLFVPQCGTLECPASPVYAAADLDARKPRLCDGSARFASSVIDAERMVAAWNAGGAAAFSKLTSHSTDPWLLRRAAIVNEMWFRLDGAAILWRRLAKSEALDAALRQAIQNRIDMTGL